jgi:hypothetical protein
VPCSDLLGNPPAVSTGTLLFVLLFVLAQRRDLLDHSRQVDGACKAQAPCDGRPASSQLQALEVGMQPSAAPRHRAVVVEDHDRCAVDLHRDQPQQNRSCPTSSASQARAQGLTLHDVAGCCRAALDPVHSTLSRVARAPTRHGGEPDGASSAPALVADEGAAAAACWISVSGRMSIRHPVSFAASRAFWPSLPIARDSW